MCKLTIISVDALGALLEVATDLGLVPGILGLYQVWNEVGGSGGNAGRLAGLSRFHARLIGLFNCFNWHILSLCLLLDFETLKFGTELF